MESELRWILLGLSIALLAGIWWWSARRSSQARGNAELREASVPSDARYSDSSETEVRPQPTTRDWGVPPFEPLSIRTADFDKVPVLDTPMMVHVDPVPVPVPVPAPAPPPVAAPSVEPSIPVSPTVPIRVLPDPASEPPPAAPCGPNAAETQRIVSVRVYAADESRWPGAQLMAALEFQGLAFGRYQVFHRKHADGRSLFCVASLVEPGTFDLASMAQQEFRGVTLFAVLPGPIEPLETLDELLSTANALAEQLAGAVHDGKGVLLSPQRAVALRDDIARFQASLPGNDR